MSALWSRASVMLFTAACFCKDYVKTYLICSDTKDKGKDTVYTFIHKLYEMIQTDVPAANDSDIIFTNGSSSEFAMKLLYTLSQKYPKYLSWKKHGKGVVDGVGRRAKSLVCQKTMSQSDTNIVQTILPI